MKEAQITNRHGKAAPRWGWSGVAPVIAPRISRAELARLRTLLPYVRTSTARLKIQLSALGARYHRYLHQDEFGPTRAEQMAGLRAMLNQLQRLLSLLSGIPRPLRLVLCGHLAHSAPRKLLSDINIDFASYGNDEEAVWQIADAASQPATAMNGAPDLKLLFALAEAAEETTQLLSLLDSTTAGEVGEGINLIPLTVIWDEESNFSIARARVGRLLRRAELALVRLEARGGPERQLSLTWLVWQICDFYHRETGKPVTNSAVKGGCYNGKPQSPAGRFVLECVAVLQPTESWLREPDHSARSSRTLPFARTPWKHAQAALERAVYFAMRDYVAHHQTGPRRGRRKSGGLTL